MKAAIDIGTNTALLLIAEYENGNLKVIREEQRMPRLGKRVDKDRILSKESMERVISALSEYREIISEEYSSVDEIILTATSAVRDASNKKEFLSQIKNKTGFAVQILSGNEEATLTYSGALSPLTDLKTSEVFVLDIGGGSTEVAAGNKTVLKDEHSYDMGCVRFTERYLKDNPPAEEQITECRKEIKNLLNTKKFSSDASSKVVGVAGTVTSLAAIELGLKEYDPEKINGYRINRSKLQKLNKEYSTYSHDQLLDLSPKVLKGRQDIFMAGLLILEEFLEYVSADEIIVSTGGIRHGVLMDAFESQ